MMGNIVYDPDADAISVRISGEKIDLTAEFTEHILIDIGSDGKIIGIEILDASEEMSKIFGRIVRKNEIKGLLCQVTQETKNEYRVRFKSPEKNQFATLLIPLYKSPLIG